MKDKIVLNYIGKVLLCFSLVLIFPIIIAIIYKDAILPFFIPQLISLFLGITLCSIKYEKNDLIFAKDGFKIVAFSWILICIIGSLPLIINGDASFVDSLFETVSGFTATGVTIFKDVEHLNKSILFWRSFTHFIAGMGVLAFVIAIIPLSKTNKTMYILKAEMPGPSVSKLVPNIKKTLGYLFGIYIILTIFEFILLLIGKTPIFDSLLISFGTAATGGFAVRNSSIASYSLFSKYVVAIFMFLFGINFNIYFLLLMKNIKSIFKSEELKVYIGLFIISVFIIFFNTFNLIQNAGLAFTEAFFHTSSFMTSTGYSIGDINIYPTTSRILALVLMVISACAGSTCSGIKISRILICLKSIKRDLTKMFHPNSVETVKIDGKIVSEEIVKNTNTFIFLYILFIIAITFIISLNKFSFETTINAVITTFANVGLCFNISNFSDFSNLSKIVLSIGMLCGRLEIFPIISLTTKIKKA